MRGLASVSNEDILHEMLSATRYDSMPISIPDIDDGDYEVCYEFCGPCNTPSIRSVIPEASSVFMKALALHAPKSLHSPHDSDSDDDFCDNCSSTTKRSTPSPVFSNSPLPISPRKLPSPQNTRSSTKSTSQDLHRKTAKSLTSNFLSVPSSLPDIFSPSVSQADLSDCGANNSLEVVTRRKKAASFGGYDSIKIDRPKRVSWADERGSRYQLINVRLIRPRLAANTSDGTNSTPGQSILKFPANKLH